MRGLQVSLGDTSCHTGHPPAQFSGPHVPSGHALPWALLGRSIELAGVACTMGTKTGSPRLGGGGGVGGGVSCP